LWFFLLFLPPFVNLLAPDAVSRLWEDTLPALTYITNWYYVLRDTSYFEQFGRPPLLQHLWSLAVEEQFYVLWPLLLLAMLGIFRNLRSKIIPFILLLMMGASAAWMFILHEPYADPSRVYYGTDTRAAGFLMGAILAFFWQPWRLSKQLHSGPFFRMMFRIGGIGSLTLILVIYSQYHEFQNSLYQGGMIVTSAISALLIIAASHPQAMLGTLFETAPFSWIGRRSYGIYLWQWPIFSMVRVGYEIQSPFLPVFVLKLALTLAVAEISYQWIEQPIRKHGFRSFFQTHSRRIGNSAPTTAFTLFVGIFLFLNIGSVYQSRDQINLRAHANNLPAPTPATSPTPTGESPSAAPALPGSGTTETPDQAAWLPSATAAMAVITPTPLAQTTATSPVPDTIDRDQISTASRTTPAVAPYAVTLIGDSVMEGARDEIKSTLGEEIYIDTKRSRNMEDLLDLAEDLAQDRTLASTVVIHLGTNRLFEEKIFDEVVQHLIYRGVDRILFINVRRPIRWEELANERFQEGAKRWEAAELLDWYEISSDQPGWFGDDRVHLTTYGKRAYADLIRQGLLKERP